jgi:hypothetical protein
MINAPAQQELEGALAREPVIILAEKPAVGPTPDETMKSRKTAAKRRWTTEKGLEIGAVGCLLAGGLGILKAIHMEQASDALLCLFASFGTCGFVCYLYFGPGSGS